MCIVAVPQYRRKISGSPGRSRPLPVPVLECHSRMRILDMLSPALQLYIEAAGAQSSGSFPPLGSLAESAER
jgi:hypothetical protein